jgi:hypothetical protein
LISENQNQTTDFKLIQSKPVNFEIRRCKNNQFHEQITLFSESKRIALAG